MVIAGVAGLIEFVEGSKAAERLVEQCLMLHAILLTLVACQIEEHVFVVIVLIIWINRREFIRLASSRALFSLRLRLGRWWCRRVLEYLQFDHSI